ncbi:MAG: T9SS type A sorting domain-containing protein [Aureispira sp.]|nr:T9SS type A sorting domain-containing protein [Aureispira sp.]
MIFYNTSKLVLYQQNEVITNVRDIGYYTFYVNDPNLPLTLDTTFLDVYVGHLKAGSTDALARAVGCDSLRKYIDTATSSRNVIFGGDFNFYDASEAGYQTLLSGVYPFYDPINSPGNWSNNTSFTAVHTQSTRATGTSLDCGAQGGIDDRFDFILATGNIITGSNSISYIPNSYKALGNDGNLFNDAINDPTNSSNIPFTVLNALHNTSDHLPIIMDLEVTYSQLNLSLEILNFRGYAQKDGSHLDWSIADANDVVYWVIERSEQGVDFSVIETLSNKSNQLTWEFLDQTTHAKVAYYRIKAIMKDGEQIYSSTIAIKTFSNDSQFRLFPNPANNYISFEYFLKGEKGLLTVFNSLGEHVKQVVYSSNQRVHTIDIQDLPTGIYNIEFISENHQYLRKFIKD